MFRRFLGILGFFVIFAGLSVAMVLIGPYSIAVNVVGGIILFVICILFVIYMIKQEASDGNKKGVFEINVKEDVVNPVIEHETQHKVQIKRTFVETKYYFKNIFGTDFNQYEVRENVPVTDIAGYANEKFQLYKTRPYQAYKAEWGNPYTFGLYQNDEVKALVMIGDGREVCKKVKYLISKMYAKKCNVPYITFWTEAPNEKDYVIMRVNKYLNNNI